MYEDYSAMEDYEETIRILLKQPIIEGGEELTVFPWKTNNGKCFPEMNLHSVMQIEPSILDASLTTFIRFGVKKRHIAADALYYLDMTEWVDEQRERTYVHKSALESDEE